MNSKKNVYLLTKVGKVIGAYYCDTGAYINTYGMCQSGYICISTEMYPIFYGYFSYYCECANLYQVTIPAFYVIRRFCLFLFYHSKYLGCRFKYRTL